MNVNTQTECGLYTEDDDTDPADTTRKLRLKGQMIYMAEWDAVIFLGTPMWVFFSKFHFVRWFRSVAIQSLNPYVSLPPLLEKVGGESEESIVHRWSTLATKPRVDIQNRDLSGSTKRLISFKNYIDPIQKWNEVVAGGLDLNRVSEKCQ